MTLNNLNAPLRGVFDPAIPRPYSRRFTDRAVQVLNDVIGEVRGYIAIWGDSQHRDSYHTWFDKARVPDMGLDRGMHLRPLMYEHAQDGVIGKAIIGNIVEIGFDEIGIWYRAMLDRSSPYFSRIVNELRRKVLKTSSATMDHTGDFYPDGAFKTWILGELSLTKTPAESRMPASVLVRAQEGEHAAARAGEAQPTFTDRQPPSTVSQPYERSIRTMDPQILSLIENLVAQGIPEADILAKIQQMLAAMAAPAAPVTDTASAPAAAPMDMGEVVSQLSAGMSAWAAERARAAEMTTLRSTVEQGMTRLTEFLTQQEAAAQQRRSAAPVQAQTPAVQGHAQTPQITNMVDLRTAHLSPASMLLVAEVMRKRGGVSEGFQRAMAHKVFEDAEKGKIANTALNLFVRSRTADGLISNTRADELMASNIAGQGEEWTSTIYLDYIWEKLRVAPITDELLRAGMEQHEIGPGADKAVIYTADTDPVWYSAPQANNIDATGRPEVTTKVSYVGSGKLEVDPGTVKAFVSYSVELEEDSLIPVANQVQSKLEITGAETVESIVMNGDTELGTTNINYDGGVQGVGLEAPYWLNSNGIIKNALSVAGRYYDANNTLSEDTFDQLLKLLPEEVTADPTKLRFLLSVRTQQAARKIPALKTKDVAGDDFTLRTGKLPPVWGVQPLQSARIRTASNNGKVSATPGNNLYGRIVLVVPEYWALVFKRKFTLETDRDILSGTTQFVASLRVAIQKRSSDASAIAFEVAQ